MDRLVMLFVALAMFVAALVILGVPLWVALKILGVILIASAAVSLLIFLAAPKG